MANLMSWGKVVPDRGGRDDESAVANEERWVAGMTSEDDAAERKCFRPGTSATRRTSDDRYLGAVQLTHWNISVNGLNTGNISISISRIKTRVLYCNS